MKKALVIWFGLSCGFMVAQDLKEASSDKAAVLEGRLRDAKPSLETKLPDGTSLTIWTMVSKNLDGSQTERIAKACAKNSTTAAKEGIRTVSADFHFDNGRIAGAQYNETLVIQNPTPSVSTNKREFVFTDGVLTSPKPGSFPEPELFVNDCLAQIDKAFENHVHKR